MSRRFLACVLMLLGACGDGGPSSPEPDSADLQANNRGVGLMGSFDYDGAFEVFDALGAAHPDWTPVLINREISRLNRQQDQDEQKALQQLQAIAETSGDLRAIYLTGILQQRRSARWLHSRPWSTPIPAMRTRRTTRRCCSSRATAKRRWCSTSGQWNPYSQCDLRGQPGGRRAGQADRANTLLELFQALEDNPRARLADQGHPNGAEGDGVGG